MTQTQINGLISNAAPAATWIAWEVVEIFIPKEKQEALFADLTLRLQAVLEVYEEERSRLSDSPPPEGIPKANQG